MSGSLDQKKPTYAPAYVVGIYPQLARTARSKGYALALHGSLQRDLDLVAIPWTKSAIPAQQLIQALAADFDLEPNHPIEKPRRKPHVCATCNQCIEAGMGHGDYPCEDCLIEDCPERREARE